MAKNPKRRPETLWKLVEARCAQLADAVHSARVSFLVALTWGFIWAWALYSAGWGYLKNIRDTYQELFALSLTHRNDVYFNDVCNQITSGITKATVTTSEKLRCAAGS